MRARGANGEVLGEGLVAIFQVVFVLTFPVVLITLPIVSLILMVVFHAPQLGFWAGLGFFTVQYAMKNLWAMLGLGVFVVMALFFAWVEFTEHEIRVSHAIGMWVATAILGAITGWLCTTWPYDQSLWQMLVFALLLFSTWGTCVDAAISTAKIVAYFRGKRPQQDREVVETQKAHGDARLAGEAEARLLLNPKR
jgi:hypothetical protein